MSGLESFVGQESTEWYKLAVSLSVSSRRTVRTDDRWSTVTGHLRGLFCEQSRVPTINT